LSFLLFDFTFRLFVGGGVHRHFLVVIVVETDLDSGPVIASVFASLTGFL